jgi:DNA-binding PadR family transcriptional regulator
MEWLTSGTRRDVCLLLYGEEVRAQTLKSRLEARYDRRVKPDRFYGALDTLESKGHVEKHVEGLEDVYSLTDAGRQHVEAQSEWMRQRIGTDDA